MQCINNTSNVPNLTALPAHHKCALETYISLWLGKTIWYKAYFMIKCWLSRVINWQRKWKTEGLSVSGTAGRVRVHPRGLVADGGPWPPPTTPEGRAAQKPGDDQQSHVQVQFQPNVRHFHIVKLKSQVEPSSVGGVSPTVSLKTRQGPRANCTKESTTWDRHCCNLWIRYFMFKT